MPLIEPTPFPQDLGGDLRHVNRDSNGAALFSQARFIAPMAAFFCWTCGTC